MNEKETLSILLVEDNAAYAYELSRRIHKYFKNQGHEVKITQALGMEEALDYLHVPSTPQSEEDKNVFGEHGIKFDAIIADSQFNYTGRPHVGAAELALSVRQQKSVREIIRFDGKGYKAGEIVYNPDRSGDPVKLNIPNADDIFFVYMSSDTPTHKFHSIKAAVDFNVAKSGEHLDDMLLDNKVAIAEMCAAILKGRAKGKAMGESV
jgi:hypothetical protein